MRHVPLILMCLLSTAANAENFDDRVRIAKDAEKADAYAPYQRTMYQGIENHLANTMRACFAKIEKPQTDAFQLVADITTDGIAKAIEVNPDTNIAKCFAEGLQTAPFPRPPEYPGREAFPIVIDMKITP